MTLSTQHTQANDAASRRWRIGFDIGGTFTDFILYDGAEHQVTLHKRLTTPRDPSEAALLGLQELLEMRGVSMAEVNEIIHGTTLVPYAIIERKAAGPAHHRELPRHPGDGHRAAL